MRMMGADSNDISKVPCTSTSILESPAEKRASNYSRNNCSANRQMSRSVSCCIGKQDVMPRGHSHAGAEIHMGMHRSLTDDDFSELKGCIELGFRFNQASIPQLSHLLPALEVCSAITHKFHEQPITISPPSWKVANPGDTPEDVKERLRHWAQAVACNLQLLH